MEIASYCLNAGDVDRDFLAPCLLGFGVVVCKLGIFAFGLIISGIACKERVDSVNEIWFLQIDLFRHQSLRSLWLRRSRSEVTIRLLIWWELMMIVTVWM